MTDFYTNVQVYGSKILYRGIENGRKVRHKVDYHPTLFVPSQKPTKFTTVLGQHVSPINPGTIRECRDFVRQYEDVQSFTIFGNQKYEYCFIADQHPHEVDWDLDHINICNIDIEVGSENGFPEPASASEPITAIAMKTAKGFFVFGCGDFVNTREDVQYTKCRDEIDLIKRFIDVWSGDYPDIITGWNVAQFDIPYLVNRITKLLGEETTKRLSPWNIINSREIQYSAARTYTAYDLLGISTLDYIDMYRKYAPDGKSQESYKLDNIAHVELGDRKLSYEDYGNLHSLYRDNYQLFIEYNIQDVELIQRLDDKLKLIELALTLAYDSKTNYNDVFAQVRMWDALIYNHLRERDMVLPPIVSHSKNEQYVGAYVKEPVPGLYKWIASFDLNSLYPHLIMQYNISPETLIEPKDYSGLHTSFLSRNISIDTMLSASVDTSDLITETITPNGQFFRTDKQGFLPEMMEKMYDDRTVYKKKAIDAKKEIELETDPKLRYEIEKRIARYNNLQLAKKVCLNSAYGALGNQFFRFFDVRQASAITTAGQLSIKWIEMKLNAYMNKILKTEDTDYVIASDTDSIYLCLDRLVNEAYLKENRSATSEQVIAFMDRICEAKIQPFIDKAFGELARYTNAYAQKMIMKREALADKGIWTAKKRYILRIHNNEGVQYAKPKLKVMGLEMIKSSTPAACKVKLWDAIEIIFNKEENDVIDFIDKFREEFRTLEPVSISFPRGVNGLQKFADAKMIYGKGCPIHVRGSLIYNHLIRKHKLEKKYEFIKEGEKIKFIYLKEPNLIQSNIISFSNSIPKELDIIKYIDYDMQYEKSFVEPLKIILDSIGWKTEHISSLESFFS
jgi:DNA polymerase elongation subunit (family B)